MLNKKEIIECLRISRTIFYIVVFLAYLYGRFFYNIDTLCNHGYTCPTCGLRTAMYYIEHGRFIDAFNSNKFCVAIVVFFLLALIDLIFICSSYLKSKNK